MNVAILVLRLVVGGLFVGHGAQKLFAWFGGHGPRATASFFESAGLVPALPLVIVAGSAELVGGLLLAAGLLTPLAALLIAAVMSAATVAVHWRHGLWNANGGFELPLVMTACAFAIAALGPGTIALDEALGIDWSGLWWAVAAVLAGALGGLAATALGRFWQRTRSRQPLAHAA
ncbi:MAG TPA: DoxX family protein [Gaiellaceae bacterium]|nr:DoxX family protein [Gaiellaceae bacterium]